MKLIITAITTCFLCLFSLKAEPTSFFKVTVEHSLTLEQMAGLGHYNLPTDELLKNFPKTSSRDEETVEVTLVHVNLFLVPVNVSTEYILDQMNRNGLRPATIEELLTVGAEFPDLQRKYPVIALGSVRESCGLRYVACLSKDTSLRYLSLSQFDGVWGADCRFLAVRK
jgi:hypothetical protein